jgi:hypothetical protein
VDASYTARFQGAGTGFNAVSMVDLSAGGICLRMDPRESGPLVKGTQVTSLFLDHQGLPTVPLQGLVSWVMGRVPGKVEGFILVGVEFMNLNPKVESALAQHVQERLGTGARP